MAAKQTSQSIIDEVKSLSEVPAPWCDEFEKMVSGMIFKSGNDRAFQQFRVTTLRNLHSFNDSSVPEDFTMQDLRDRRMRIAKKIIGKLGEDVNILYPFFVGWGCNTFIGDNVYINRDVSIHDDAPVFIGSRTLIGPGVCLCTSTHDLDPSIRIEQGGSFAKPIRIGDDCWIGARAIILPGVTVGHGSMVAAGAVVSKDVEAGYVVGGCPARVIRKLGIGSVKGDENGK